MKVGVVCEGIHDFPALSVLISEIAQAVLGEEAVCLPLQPAADASSRSGDGGWPKVVAWCQANAGNGLDTYLRAPLFEGEEVYDLIVVHLDGDIAVECADQFGGALPVPPSVEDRVAFLSSKLKNWVDPDSNYEKQIKFAVPTQKTESWMLAGISDNAHNWEEIESKSVLLLETGFVQGPGRAQHYRDVAVKLLGMSEKIAARCRSFQLFRDQFSQ